jgi:hypothetical protein
MAETQKLLYLPTRMVLENDEWRRVYELPARDEMPPPHSETLPPQRGDKPRIFIIGPQRAMMYDGERESELERRFAEAHDSLRNAGYEGISIRFVPVTMRYVDGVSCGATLFPGGAGVVPEHRWQSEVRARMQHCQGVALLPAVGDSDAVEWERALAAELGKPVRPLVEWTSPGTP